MCGIVGCVWNAGAEPISHQNFDRMTDLLSHRGPDGRGIHRLQRDNGSGVTLGHRRLSIIDLAGGKQPLSNEDGTVWITFNGEIYNYRELRPALEAAGHRFATQSDTETIVHLYEEYGDRFVEHLRGMFAIGIWDEKRQRLVLARDRMGQKPLVYHCSNERLIFASELKSIAAAAGVRKRVRPSAIDEYLLYGYIPHPGTIYEDLHKLPPAHLAIYEHGQLRLQRYWNPDLSPDETLQKGEMQERLKAVIGEAVRLRMRSDVPLGAFLSGGIDSTVITGVMQQQAVTPVKTYTIGFPVSGYDESAFAQQAADFLHTEHHRMEVHPNSLDTLEKLVWHFDEPFADSSAIPTYYLSQMTRQHVKVALTGDGGDELFCGYERYKTIQSLGAFDRLPQAFQRLITGSWIDRIPGQAQQAWGQKLRHRLKILREPFEKRYLNWLTGFPLERRLSLYNPDFLRGVDLEHSSFFVESKLAETRALDPGVRAMRADLGSYLPCDLLAKVDITSMAHGLECRSPFMDHVLIETAAKIPYHLLAEKRQIKPCLSQTFQELIPAALQSRPKQGFSVPLDRWFRHDLKSFAQETLLARNARCHAYFSPKSIEDLFIDHQSGKWRNGDRIWSLLFFELWSQSSDLDG